MNPTTALGQVYTDQITGCSGVGHLAHGDALGQIVRGAATPSVQGRSPGRAGRRRRKPVERCCYQPGTGRELGHLPSSPLFSVDAMGLSREKLNALARSVDNQLPDGTGFIVFAFPFDFAQKDEGNMLNYVSNAKREDVINILKEWMIRCGAAEDWMKAL